MFAKLQNSSLPFAMRVHRCACTDANISLKGMRSFVVIDSRRWLTKQLVKRRLVFSRVVSLTGAEVHLMYAALRRSRSIIRDS